MRSLALLFIAAASIVSACSSEGPTSNEEDDEEAGATEDPLSGPAAQGPVEFSDACKAGTSITLAAVGDVLLHSPLQRQAYSAADGHHSLWKAVEPLINRADLTWANLEGPCADGVTTGGSTRDPGRVFDNNVYSSYPQFNYHPSLIDALKETGIDIVSTANNHAMDRRSLGVDKTIDNLNAKGLPFVGTHKSTDGEESWTRIVEAKGIKLGFVACTFSTNGLPDSKNQVLSCYEDKTKLLSLIGSLKSQVDAVVVTPHWGTEYNHSPDSQDKNLGRAMLEAGALAVIGNHPHVTQPMEKIKTSDGRETFIIYSLGNFVSGQTGIDKRSSEIVYLGFTKGTDGKTTINGVRHLPIYMQNGPYTAVPAEGHSADSDALTTRILGKWNRIGVADPLVTNPSCSQ